MHVNSPPTSFAQSEPLPIAERALNVSPPTRDDVDRAVGQSLVLTHEEGF